MGHTIQETRINGACGNRAIRIDVGMSRGVLTECLKFWRLLGIQS